MPKTAVKITPAVLKVIRPPVSDIIRRCLREHWGFKGDIPITTALNMGSKAKEALRRCVADKVNLERDTRITLPKEDMAEVKTIGELEKLTMAMITKERGRRKKIPV